MQDDYGNSIERRAQRSYDERLEAVERQSDALAKSVRQIEQNTTAVVQAFQAAEGAFRTLEFFGKLAKPLLGLGVLAGGCMWAWERAAAWWKH